MANRKATMTDLREIIREFAKGTPLREIERTSPLYWERRFSMPGRRYEVEG